MTSLVSYYKVFKLVRKTLILSIASGFICKHQESSKQSGSYTTLSIFFLRLKITLCEIKHGSTPHLEKKENNSAEKEGFSVFLFPLPLARNKENGNIESWILKGLCTMHYRYILCQLWENTAVDEALFWSTVRDEISRIKNSFVENIDSFLNLSYPICHY